MIQKAVTAEPTLLTTPQLQKAVQMSAQTIRKLRNAGRIPAICAGRRKFWYRLDDVLAALRSGPALAAQATPTPAPVPTPPTQTPTKAKPIKRKSADDAALDAALECPY
jgi:hypothetical protein